MSNNNNLNQNKHINNKDSHHISPSCSNVSTLTTRSRSSTARSNSTTQACAACRYQRQKCASDCVLAPFFLHDKQHQFQNAHRLFGVSNITKIIKDLDPPRKEEATRKLIFQSDMRALDPVGGCYRIIRDYQRQIEYWRTGLEIVLHQLAIYQAHGAQNQNQNQNQHILIDGCDFYDIETDDNNNHINHDIQNDLNNNHGIDLDLGQTTHNHDHEQYIITNQDNGCEDENVINSWADMNNSSQSSNLYLEVKSVRVADECEEFKQLLIMRFPREKDMNLSLNSMK